MKRLVWPAALGLWCFLGGLLAGDAVRPKAAPVSHPVPVKMSGTPMERAFARAWQNGRIDAARPVSPARKQQMTAQAKKVARALR